MSAGEDATLRIERVVYGGFGLARPEAPDFPKTPAALVPFSLPGEVVRAVAPAEGSKDWRLTQVLQPSPARTEPGCPHFGVCGGCHLQMGTYEEQLRLKRDVLTDSLRRAGVANAPAIETHSAEPWGYRNRIRLHVTSEGGALRLGYRRRNSHEVLPIATCPIAAPLLWRAAEALLALSESSPDVNTSMRAATEVELFCNADETRLQATLLFSARPGAGQPGSFERAMSALAASVPELSGAGAVLVHAQSGRPTEQLANFGAAGMPYAVRFAGREELYWIARGGFFQVNRFLTGRLLELVCAGRSGALAWDLFAGVGLFARVLARSFAQVVAVEANPVAAAELAASLRRLGPHVGKQGTTSGFLRDGVLQRERPELVVLDPPRAGAGAEVCSLLAQIAPREIVYVSCDPTTLARDLAQLQGGGYALDALHLVDLFPQTYHQEAVATLSRP
jgi:23S rRNA (uracil1939-C5)-methyltransferase